MKSFGKFLKHLREKDGLTQADLGRMLEMNKSTFRYLESDLTRLPKLGTLIHIADAFNMKGWQLLKKYEEWK